MKFIQILFDLQQSIKQYHAYSMFSTDRYLCQLHQFQSWFSQSLKTKMVKLFLRANSKARLPLRVRPVQTDFSASCFSVLEEFKLTETSLCNLRRPKRKFEAPQKGQRKEQLETHVLHCVNHKQFLFEISNIRSSNSGHKTDVDIWQSQICVQKNKENLLFVLLLQLFTFWLEFAVPEIL